MSEMKAIFSPEVERELTRLGIKRKENFPEAEKDFYIYGEEDWSAPLPITQFLWGYEWENYVFKLTDAGKAFYYYSEEEDPTIIFTADWTESGSRYGQGDSTYLCIGKITGTPDYDKLLIDIKQPQLGNPEVSIEMPCDPLGIGTMDTLSTFLSHLIAVPTKKAAAFSEKVESELTRLGIKRREVFPEEEEAFYINDESRYTIPLPITQFLWGYEWENYELKLTPEGKTFHYFEETDDPTFIFTTEWRESGSLIYQGLFPCLCVGKVIGISYMDKLVINVEDVNPQNPGLSVMMPYTNRLEMGTLDDLSIFLSHIEAVPASEAKKEAEAETDKEFSEVISSFVNAMKLDAGEEQEEKLKHFNRLCNQFFTKHPASSIATIADGLTQLGVPYEQAIGDVTWARTFGE